ncbi:MAG: MarC family NAAT transporter [bacterium]|nr:MarC family NAAT transporter [bacterium]
MIGVFFTTVLGTLIALLPIANPFSTAVVFLGLTKGYSKARCDETAYQASVYMAGVLLVFLVAGALIMQFFGISLPAVRIAGGLIVARIGFNMLTPGDEPLPVEKDGPGAGIAFTPLAMPMLSGPGAIAVTIGMAAGAEGFAGHLAIATGIAAVAGISFVVLREANRIVSFLGPVGMDALSRIMGFLLVCVGIQFFAVAIGEILSDDVFMEPILRAVARATARLE